MIMPDPPAGLPDYIAVALWDLARKCKCGPELDEAVALLHDEPYYEAARKWAVALTALRVAIGGIESIRGAHNPKNN